MTGIGLLVGGGTGLRHPSAPLTLNRLVVGTTSTAGGYRLVAFDGGSFKFGAAHSRGSEGGTSRVPAFGTMRRIKSGHIETGARWLPAVEGTVAGGAPSAGSTGGGDPRAALEAAIVGVASSQVGQTNPALYGGSGGEWCAAFVSWVYRSAGLPVGVLTAAYQIGTWAQSGGAALLPPSATPQPGDAVLFEPNGSGLAWPGPGLDISSISHVNIVASVNPDGSFTTIGGNESAGGVSAVRHQGPYSAANAPSWWGQKVYGFVRPR